MKRMTQNKRSLIKGRFFYAILKGVNITEIFKLFGSIMVNNDKANQSIDETDGKAQKTSKSFGAMLGSAAKMGAGIALAVGAAAVAVGGLAVSFTEDLQKALNGVQASTGVADEAMAGMKDTMVAIYNNNFGDSFEEIGNAMMMVNQQTGLAGEELQKMTEGAFTLRDTFEMDVAGSVETASVMMKNFGIDSEQAYNMIAQGAQWGLNKQGDLLDILKEYGPHFATLGFSAEEAMNMLANGAAGGVFSIDQLGDVVHEFGRQMKESDVSEPLKKLGLNAAKYTDMVAAGGDKAKQAFTEIGTKLGEMKDKTKQTEIGLALYGDMWGEVQAEGILAMVNTQGEISNTVDALGKINEVKYNTFGEAMQGIKRNLETGLLLPLGESIMPALNGMANWIQTNMPAIQNEIEYAMGIVGDVFNKVVDVVKTYVVPQFERFAELIKANMPAIKQAISDMYNRVKPHFDKLVGVIKTDLMPIIQGMWGLIERAMPTIRVLFEIAMGAVGIALGIAMDIIGAFIEIAKGIYDFIQPKVQLVIDIFNKVADGIQWAIDKLKKWNNEPAEDKTVTTNFIDVRTAKTIDDHLGNNAQGTDFWRGGATWVGEQGPEIVNLPRGSQVFSNEKSMDMTGGKTQTVIVPVYLDGKEIARVIAPFSDIIQGKGVSLAGRAVGV